MKNLGELDVGLKCLPNTEAGNMKCMNKTLILGERESIKNMARDVWLVPRKRNIAFGKDDERPLKKNAGTHR